VGYTGEVAMSAFEEREEGFEKRFAHDEELRFKALARRNKRLGLWAAELIGLRDDAANAFASRLVEAEVGRADDESVAATLKEAFAGAKVDMSENRLRRQIREMTAAAIDDIAAGR
jgi:hypothetical protein